MIAILTDKPNVGKEIARILGAHTREDGYISGNGYMVTWTFSNMLSLAMPKDYGMDRPERGDFPINPAPFRLMVKHIKTDTGWIPDINAVLQLKVIEKVFDACESIIAATDASREGEIRKYHTKKNYERALLEQLTEGTAYISHGSPSIMQYSYDWAYEEAPDFRPVGLETQIMVTWSVKDAMNDEMESYFNSDYQESYVITPVTTFHLTPDTEKPFSMDDFPERFSHWLERFTKLITNNF